MVRLNMDENLVENIQALNQKNMELLSSFSPAALIGGVIFGIVGLYCFRYGRKQLNHKVMVVGIALMVYPLFISQALSIWVVGSALSALAYYWKYN